MRIHIEMHKYTFFTHRHKMSRKGNKYIVARVYCLKFFSLLVENTNNKIFTDKNKTVQLK